MVGLSDNRTNELKNNNIFSIPTPFNLNDDEAYQLWKTKKLADYPGELSSLIVPVNSCKNPSSAEISAIKDRCQIANMAIYEFPDSERDMAPEDLRAFASRFSMSDFESHRSAGASGVVSLEVSSQGTKRGYIPYSDLPLSWHTDGYYAEIDKPIRSMILHCVRSAMTGGESEFLDPEIAYIRLRDRDPAYIGALMHPEAMLIPANTEPDGSIRPERIGPVFSVGPTTGNLHMRYSARGRNIEWRNDQATAEARAYLLELLQGGEPLVHNARLKPGQGLLCNNVLHRRTGFSNPEGGNGRLLYRLRCRDRIS